MPRQLLQLARNGFTNVKCWSPQATTAARDKKSDLQWHARSCAPRLGVLPYIWRKSSRNLERGARPRTGPMGWWDARIATALATIGSERIQFNRNCWMNRSVAQN